MNNACEHGPYDGRASAALESKYEKEAFAISGLETFDPSSVATAFGGETPDRFYTRSLSKNLRALRFEHLNGMDCSKRNTGAYFVCMHMHQWRGCTAST